MKEIMQELDKLTSKCPLEIVKKKRKARKLLNISVTLSRNSGSLPLE